ncbi:hypothetical protein SNEBB_005318 [Seison nebaliae]|nr:hypothetical protein SNEBB_005318 [Seison nebaliae]
MFFLLFGLLILRISGERTNSQLYEDVEKVLESNFNTNHTEDDDELIKLVNELENSEELSKLMDNVDQNKNVSNYEEYGDFLNGSLPYGNYMDENVALAPVEDYFGNKTINIDLSNGTFFHQFSNDTSNQTEILINVPIDNESVTTNSPSTNSKIKISPIEDETTMNLNEISFDPSAKIDHFTKDSSIAMETEGVDDTTSELANFRTSTSPLILLTSMELETDLFNKNLEQTNSSSDVSTTNLVKGEVTEEIATEEDEWKTTGITKDHFPTEFNDLVTTAELVDEFNEHTTENPKENILISATNDKSSETTNFVDFSTEQPNDVTIGSDKKEEAEDFITERKQSTNSNSMISEFVEDQETNINTEILNSSTDQTSINIEQQPTTVFPTALNDLASEIQQWTTVNDQSFSDTMLDDYVDYVDVTTNSDLLTNKIEKSQSTEIDFFSDVPELEKDSTSPSPTEEKELNDILPTTESITENISTSDDGIIKISDNENKKPETDDEDEEKSPDEEDKKQSIDKDDNKDHESSDDKNEEDEKTIKNYEDENEKNLTDEEKVIEDEECDEVLKELIIDPKEHTLLLLQANNSTSDWVNINLENEWKAMSSEPFESILVNKRNAIVIFKTKDTTEPEEFISFNTVHHVNSIVPLLFNEGRVEKWSFKLQFTPNERVKSILTDVYSGEIEAELNDMIVITWHFDLTNDDPKFGKIIVQLILVSGKDKTYALHQYVQTDINGNYLLPATLDVAPLGMECGYILTKDRSTIYQFTCTDDAGSKADIFRSLTYNTCPSIQGLQIFTLSSNISPSIQTPKIEENKLKQAIPPRVRIETVIDKTTPLNEVNEEKNFNEQITENQCSCPVDYVGNGKKCLPNIGQLIIQSSVKGNLNGIPIQFKYGGISSKAPPQNVEYWATGRILDGLSYQVYRPLFEEIPLYYYFMLYGVDYASIWLASSERYDVINGRNISGISLLRLTGGKFHRTSSLTFTFWQKKTVVKVEQQFNGLEELAPNSIQGKISASMEINGNLPLLGPYFPRMYPERMRIEPHNVKLYKVGPGKLRGLATYRVAVIHSGKEENQNPQKQEVVTIEVDDIITYEEDESCPSNDQNIRQFEENGSVLKLLEPMAYAFVDSSAAADNHYVNIKFQQRSLVYPNKNENDEWKQCISLNCDLNAKCERDPYGRFECECRKGFEGDGKQCQDINECSKEHDICGKASICTNTVGSYSCKCNDKYVLIGNKCVHPYDETPQGTIKRPNYHYAVKDTSYLNNDPNAVCETDYRSHRRNCRCKFGYVPYEKECEPNSNYICRSNKDCDIVGGECANHPRIQRTVCRCKTGFNGDGKICNPLSCVEYPSICDVSRATCNHLTKKCQCKAGFDGTGHDCRLVGVSGRCDLDAKQCDINAECLLHPISQTYYCVCRLGFIGDGFQCRSASQIRGHRLAYAQSNYVMTVDTSNRKREQPSQISYTPQQQAVAVTYDCSRQKIFWSDLHKRTVYQAKLDGYEMRTLLYDVIVEGMAVDHNTGNIFAIDTDRNRIIVKNPGITGEEKVIVDNGLRMPRSIAIDNKNGIIYWTDWQRDNPRIECSFMDGSNRNVLLNRRKLLLPNAVIWVDATKELCWADAGHHKIECAEIYLKRSANDETIVSISKFRTIVQGRSKVEAPFGLAFDGKDIYWTDWTKKWIGRVTLLSPIPQEKESVNFAYGANGKIFGITTVQESCPNEQTQCSYDNGRCANICVPLPYNKRKCL